MKIELKDIRDFCKDEYDNNGRLKHLESEYEGRAVFNDLLDYLLLEAKITKKEYNNLYIDDYY